MSSTAESVPTQPSFAERVAEFAHSQGCPPYEGPDFTNTPMRVREELVHRHGSPDSRFSGEWVYPGRTVIEVPGWTWAAERPEDCPDEPFTGIWFDHEGSRLPNLLGPNANTAIVLLCSLCGLDCT